MKDPQCEYYGVLPALVRLTDTSPTSALQHQGGQAPRPVNTPNLFSTGAFVTTPLAQLPPRPQGCLRLVLISDTHERHREMVVPPGDVLIHCGDVQEGLSVRSWRTSDLAEFFAWFNRPDLHPHPAKLIIGGNHDRLLQKMKVAVLRTMAAPALYLQEESAILEPFGLRFFGSPRSLSNSVCSPNTAFQSAEWWKPIPVPLEVVSPDTTSRTSLHEVVSDEIGFRLEGQPLGPIDVLVTHQSPDSANRKYPVNQQKVTQLVQQVAPRRLHCAGHLHGAHGLHQLPVPAALKASYGYRQGESVDAPVGVLPFFPSINAAMMIRKNGCNRLLWPSVIDLEL